MSLYVVGHFLTQFSPKPLGGRGPMNSLLWVRSTLHADGIISVCSNESHNCIIFTKVCAALALADPQPEAQGVQGGQGYNPGVSGGQGYNPGGGGGQGYNPGNEGGQGYNPGGDGGQGYNPGGQQGYNPGINYLPLDLNQEGYNPGSSNFLPLDPSQHPGGPNIQPLDPIQQGGGSGMFNPNARPLGPSPQRGQPGQCGMVDECCGMAQQGCCVEGQQCYTYYTQECESVDAPVCNKRLRNLCHEATVPDCQVRRNPGNLVKNTPPTSPILLVLDAHPAGLRACGKDRDVHLQRHSLRS